MKKHCLKIVSFLLLLTFLFPTASAAVPRLTANPLQQNAISAQSSAEALYKLGLVQGYAAADGGVNFALEDSLTRAQAMALVVRFLGAEAEALEGSFAHPFSDVPAWAAPYVGYVYTNGIAQGVDKTRFGTDAGITEAAFLTSILRVLGYEDANDGGGDFVWSDPFTLAKTAGLTENSAPGATFCRGDAFQICYRALTAAPKSGDRIADRLIARGVFTKELLESVISGSESAPVKEETAILPIAQLNTDGTDGDHAEDDFRTASLEIDYRSNVTLSSAVTGYTRYNFAWYPRVKKVRDDLYLLLYHYGQYGMHLYYATSSDGKNWNAPQVLYNAANHKFTYADGPFAGTEDKYHAVNADACVLDNGDILVAYSVRPNHGYNKQEYIDLNGIYLVRGTVSANNRITWSKQTRVYTGQTWEPSILQRSDGRIELYFTQIAPYIAKYGFDTVKRSSCTGMITSKDGGYSWTPDIQPGDKNYYAATRVFQQSIGKRNGVPYFSGQMPVATELYNGKTLLAVEIHEQNDTFWISYATSEENGAWKALGIEDVGPSTTAASIYKAAAPYVSRFPSGETYLTYGSNSQTYGRIGSPDGTMFSSKEALMVPLGKGSWASNAIVGSHCVVTANAGPEGEARGIRMTYAYLNHRINAPKTTMRIDGYTADWEKSTDALFVGSESQAQLTLRTAHDDENIYFLVSRLDSYVTKKDTATVVVAAGNTSYYQIVLDLDGIQSIAYYENGTLKRSLTGGEVAVKILGTTGVNTDCDTGVVTEVAIPKSLFDLADKDRFAVRLALTNDDGDGTVINDTFTGVSVLSSALWPSVVLD